MILLKVMIKSWSVPYFFLFFLSTVDRWLPGTLLAALASACARLMLLGLGTIVTNPKAHMRQNAIGRILPLKSFVNDVVDKDSTDEALPDSVVALCELTFSATTIIKPRSWLKTMRKRCLFMAQL